MASGWSLRPFMAVLTAPQGNLYLCISTEEEDDEKKFHFPKIPPTSSSLPVPLTTAVYVVNWNGVCFILNNLVIDWGGGQRDSRVIYIPVHGAVISRRLSTASPSIPPSPPPPRTILPCMCMFAYICSSLSRYSHSYRSPHSPFTLAATVHLLLVEILSYLGW